MVKFDEEDEFVFVKQLNRVEILDTSMFLPVSRIDLPKQETHLFISPKRENLKYIIC